MRIIIVMLMTPLVISTCPANNSGSCPSVWDKYTMAEGNETGTILVRPDKTSGCMCRTLPGYYFCFGRDFCKAFPKNIPFSIKKFILRASQISEIKPGDLNSLIEVEVLKVESNDYLVNVSAGSFLQMTKLKELSISYNTNLRILRRGSFDGLVNLERLILIKNAFNKLAELTPVLTSLPKLYKLELNENVFTQIENNDFLPLQNSSLYELNLVLCQIEYIEPKAFNPLKNLTILRVGENLFSVPTISQAIEEMITAHVPLKSLNLYSIGLKKNNSRQLLDIIAKSNICHLCLAKNQIDVINSETFPSMPNIQILDLREVLTSNITTNAFVGLPNLRSLFLGENKLNSLPDGLLLKQLTCLDLQKTSNGRLSSTYFSLHGPKFNNMKSLQRLNLSFSKINALYNTSFLGLKNLKFLALKSSTIKAIQNNSFAQLSNLEFLNLENNPFVTYHPELLQNKLFTGLDNLEVLLLGGCDIKYLNSNTFKSLKNLKHLGLERNKLTTLPNIDALINLEIVDLSQNIIRPWNLAVFRHNRQLTDLRISGNKLTQLTPAMIKDFNNLTYLDLTENFFTCDCFSGNSNKIIDLIKYQNISCAFPDSSLTLIEFLENNTDCQNILILVLPTVFVIFCLICTIFGLYYFRWHWRYWLFLTRLHLSRNRKIRNTNIKGCGNYFYDAFVSYSSEDRNFVIKLVTMLENYPPYIKLCVYERDFEVGTMISENVLESVAKSRKTLLIISNSYAKSLWCRWESQIAEHHRLFFQNENGEYVDNSLILIKLGPVNETYMTPTLRYLLKTRIYLQWSEDENKQSVFWEKLRNALAPPIEINENTYL